MLKFFAPLIILFIFILPTHAYAIDTLKISNKEIDIKFTDDNTGEDFIIKTDKKDYYTLGGDILIHFSITNISNTEQEANIIFSLGKSQFIRSIDKFNSYQTIVDKVANATTTETYKEIDTWDNIIFDKTFDISKNIINRKDTLNRQISNTIKDNFKINETQYYRATINAPLGITENEWFIEVIGINYGHLDPNNWTYHEDFESMSTGDLNTQDSWTADTEFDISTTNPIEQTQSVYVATNGSNKSAYRSITNKVSGTVYQSAKFTTAGNLYHIFRLKDSGGSEGPGFGIWTSGEIVYWNGAAWTQIGSETVGDDEEVRIGVQFECGSGMYEGLSADTFKMNVNDGSWYGPYNFTNAITSVALYDMDTYTLASDKFVWIDHIAPDYGEPEVPAVEATTTPMIYSTDLSLISGLIETEDENGNSTGYREIFIHIPFIVWLIITVISVWIGSRLILEFIIRFRN